MNHVSKLDLSKYVVIKRGSDNSAQAGETTKTVMTFALDNGKSINKELVTEGGKLELDGQSLSDITNIDLPQGKVVKVSHGSTVVWTKPVNIRLPEGQSKIETTLTASVDGFYGDTIATMTTNGYNVFNFGNRNGEAVNGIVSSTDNNGYITAKGTFTDTWTVVSATDSTTSSIFLKQGIYIFSIDKPTNVDVYLHAIENGAQKTLGIIRAGATAIKCGVAKPVNTVRIALPGAVGGKIDIRIRPMLEKGSTAHPYERYTGGIPAPNLDYPCKFKHLDRLTINVSDDKNVETVYIPLGKDHELRRIGNYRDRIFYDGVWKLERRIIEINLTGSEGWIKDNEGGNFGYILNANDGVIASRDRSVYDGYCTLFTFEKSQQAWTGVGKGGWRGAKGNLWIQTRTNMSPAEFKNAIASKKAELYYVLASPTITIIDNVDTVNLLNKLRDIYHESGKYEFSASAYNGCSTELDLSYLKKGA